MQFRPIVFGIGLIFGFLAALSAFFITYGEYQHHYSDSKVPRKLALETGIGTFIFFLILSLTLNFF